MQLNVKLKEALLTTHEGARAVRTSATNQLRRSVMSCMLWEDQFYENGVSIAERIADLIPQVDATSCMDIAIEARQQFKLRHAPLLIARIMARLPEHKALVAHTLEQIIDRPDEITEFLAIYWADKKQPLSSQVKKGLAAAFNKFNEYQLAKYNRDGKVKLRDALFLVHAKPKDAPERQYTKLERQEKKRMHLSAGETLFKKLVDNELTTPDTWEVALSGGADKAETFGRLIAEKKLGALALLRNLRNMDQSGMDKGVVAEALSSMNADRVLPFRFIAAARAVPKWEDIIEPPMLACIAGREKMQGHTILLIDVSGSMDSSISRKSDLMRLDAACGLAILLREICANVEVFTFSTKMVQVAPRRGFALRDAIVQSQPHGGTYLGQAVNTLNAAHKCDRLIVITDEQSHDDVPPPDGRGYMINVASAKNGVGYGKWMHIDGWSEAIIDYIIELEKEPS